MDHSHPTAPLLFGGRYLLGGENDQGIIEVLDREPWRRCWSCGSTDNEPGESYCMQCGAELKERRYRGMITPSDNATGLTLLTTIKDDFARSLLPAVWDQVQQDNQTLVLLHDGGASQATLPLDELAALRVGSDLARLLATLHQQGLTLSAISPEDVGFTATGKTRLLNVPHLRRIEQDEHDEAVRADLQEVGELLEELTGTPRTTQRLDEKDEELMAEPEPVLTTILRQVRTRSTANASDLAKRLDALIAERVRVVALTHLVGARSDTGVVRDHNEDSLFALHLTMNSNSLDRTWGLYIVADGMGGHAAGEVASSLAIQGAAQVILAEYLAHSLDPSSAYDEQWSSSVVRRAVSNANDAVRNEGHARGNDMGTTLTMALVIGDRAIIANVGDSRTYLYREGKLRRISKDHSLVMRLVELGQITEDDIYTHPQRNAVLRSLGDQLQIEVDVFHERLVPGDALFLCSDGQWEMTRLPAMERIIAQHDDPERVCQELINAANQAGGEDNITALLVRFA